MVHQEQSKLIIIRYELLLNLSLPSCTAVNVFGCRTLWFPGACFEGGERWSSYTKHWQDRTFHCKTTSQSTFLRVSPLESSLFWSSKSRYALDLCLLCFELCCLCRKGSFRLLYHWEMWGAVHCICLQSKLEPHVKLLYPVSELYIAELLIHLDSAYNSEPPATVRVWELGNAAVWVHFRAKTTVLITQASK